MVKPDIFCAGIKEKYVVQKMGVPCKQLHSYDYGGPYAGFQGAINFYEEDRSDGQCQSVVFIDPPWKDERSGGFSRPDRSTGYSRIDWR